jgi:hypothetical protein
MSSIFGHDLAAVYRDRAYALRPRGSWLAIGAAFAVGAGAAIAVMKIPASPSGEPAQAMAPQTVSKPGTPPAQGAAGKSETAAKAPIRVIAPEVVPPPPNVTTAVTREAPRPQPKTAAVDTGAVTDPNVGAAPRDQVVDAAPAGIVPMPPPKPAELRVSAANQSPPDASKQKRPGARPSGSSARNGAAGRRSARAPCRSARRRKGCPRPTAIGRAMAAVTRFIAVTTMTAAAPWPTATTIVPAGAASSACSTSTDRRLTTSFAPAASSRRWPVG